MLRENKLDEIFRKESIFSILINVFGASLTFFYLKVIDPIPDTAHSLSELSSVETIIFWVTVTTFMSLGIGLGNRLKKKIKKWFLLIERGEIMPTDVPENIRRDVLNFPIYAAAIATMMWGSASVFASYVTSSLRIFIGLMGWGGSMAITLLFFVNDLLWRPVLPLFFPDGDFRRVKAFYMPIFWKLLIAFSLIGILPPTLLVYLTWQRIQALLLSSNPEVLLENIRILQFFVLFASLTASVALTFFITRGITAPIEMVRDAMEHIRKGDLDARVEVLTNDEVGYLGAGFNQMTAELRQKKILQNTNTVLREQLRKIQMLESALREQATRDPLTGLFNRRYMIEVLERELRRAARQKTKFSIVMIDLDNLKVINDTYGHVEGGDRSLKTLANILEEHCRKEDTLCRYGGDEFIAILYDTSAEAAYRRALEWKEAVFAQKIIIGDEVLTIAFSAGIVEYPPRPINIEELLHCADQALYQAKTAGRNQVVFFKDAAECGI